MSDPIAFATSAGDVTGTRTSPSRTGGPGPRVWVEISGPALQQAYGSNGFRLADAFPGGDVPGIDTGRPVTLELRLCDEFESLLAASSREPGVLAEDLVALTASGNPHLLLDADSWEVASLHQQGAGRRRPDVDFVTMFDSRAERVAERDGDR